MTPNGGSEAVLARFARAAQQAAHEMLGTLLAIPLSLLFVFAVLVYARELLHSTLAADRLVNSVAAIMVCSVGAVFFWVVKRKTAFRPVVFLACSLVAATAIYCAYMFLIQVAWVSDFMSMWQHALKMVAHTDFAVRSVYDERALPVLVPLVLIFGPNPTVVPIVNLIMLLLIQLAGYDLARRILGHRAAQGFVVLWLGAIEPVFALRITSHDLWGLFFLVVFLWGFRATCDIIERRDPAWRRWVGIAACAIALAGVLVLFEMQRELVPVLIVGAVVAALFLAAKGGVRLKAAISLMAVALALYAGMAWSLKHAGYMQSAEQGQRLAQIRTGIYGSSLSNGTYRQGQVLWKEFFLPQEPAERQDLAYAIPLSDLTLQPLARIGNVLERSRKQAQLGSQTRFYHADARMVWPTMLPLARAYNAGYSILISLLGLVSIVIVLRHHRSYEGLVLLGLMSVLTGTLVLAGESQPRYLFPIWFVMAQLIPYAAVEWMGRAKDESLAARVRTAIVAVARGLLLLLAAYLLLALAARWLYSESHGRILSGWEPALDPATTAVPKDWFETAQERSGSRIGRLSGDRRGTLFGDFALVLKFPAPIAAGGSVSARKKVCVGVERRSLDFFYYMPNRKPALTRNIRLEVLIDGRVRESFAWPTATMARHARVPDVLPANGCGVLTFRLSNDGEAAGPAMIGTSQIDLYFVRLVR